MGDALTVNVADLLRSPGVRKTVRLQDPALDLSTDLATLDEPVRVEARIEALDEASVLVDASITGSYRDTCARCLKETAREFQLPVREVYERAADGGEDGYLLAEDEIDLTTLVSDAVGLELPQHPLCRDDCAGLCPSCGVDRNVETCECRATSSDHRWDALRTLLE